MDNYTYQYTVNSNGTITFISSYDGKPQNISSAPLDDATAFKKFCDDYQTAYITGKEQEKLDAQTVPVDPAITQNANTPQTVTVQDVVQTVSSPADQPSA